MVARGRDAIRRALSGAVPERAAGLLARVRSRPDRLDNVRYNRDLWNWYARRWRGDVEFRRNEAEVAGTEISVLGDEWGSPEDLEEVCSEFIYPFLPADGIVGEIGSGGGRVAAKVVDRVRELYCFDISEEMLAMARAALASRPNARFVLLREPELPRELAGQFDFIYCFDVMVHLDLHTIWRYVQELTVTLKPSGRAFLHTANLTAPGGWESFARQREYRPEGHYFVSPEIVHTLAHRAGLRIVKESTVDPSNFYFNRDYLFVVERPE